MEACCKNDLQIIQLLIDKYPCIIQQKNNNGWTMFMESCYNNKLQLVKLFVDKYPFIIE